MPRILDPRRTATSPAAPARLADLAPAFATRVTVATDKSGHGTVRALRPTGRRHARPVEDYPFIDPVTAGTSARPGGVLWVLTVDMDHDDSLLRIFAADVPAPSWIIEKGRNGHVQAGWIIEPVALGPKARPEPIAYAEDVRAALTAAVGGDPAFTNHRQWNPTWPGWATEGRVIWQHTAPRTLGALRAEMIERGSWPTTEARSARRRTHPDAARALVDSATRSITVQEGERNRFVFDYARLRAFGTVANAAAEANTFTSPPLPAAEVAGIVRSIERYEARGTHRATGTHGHRVSDAYRARQAQRGHVGGTRNSPAQRAARTDAARRATAARSSRATERAREARRKARHDWTTAQIAEHFKVTTRTVRGWLTARPHRAENTRASGYPRPLPGVPVTTHTPGLPHLHAPESELAISPPTLRSALTHACWPAPPAPPPPAPRTRPRRSTLRPRN